MPSHSRTGAVLFLAATAAGAALLLTGLVSTAPARAGVRLPQRGEGYAAEITQALLHLAFAMLKLERAEAYALSDNARACRAMEKAGLMKEGVLRHYHREGKNFRDVCLYAMIRQDWKE